MAIYFTGEAEVVGLLFFSVMQLFKLSLIQPESAHECAESFRADYHS